MTFPSMRSSALGAVVAGVIGAGASAASAAPVIASKPHDMTKSMIRISDGFSLRVGPGGVGVRIGEGERRHYHRGRRFDWGPGFYLHEGHYYGDCGWLKSRARETGSRVWWRRYRQCRRG